MHGPTARMNRGLELASCNSQDGVIDLGNICQKGIGPDNYFIPSPARIVHVDHLDLVRRESGQYLMGYVFHAFNHSIKAVHRRSGVPVMGGTAGTRAQITIADSRRSKFDVFVTQAIAAGRHCSARSSFDTS